VGRSECKSEGTNIMICSFYDPWDRVAELEMQIELLEGELRGVQIAYGELSQKYDRLDKELEACFEKNYIDYDYSDGKC